jgi:hypothetical protein
VRAELQPPEETHGSQPVVLPVLLAPTAGANLIAVPMSGTVTGVNDLTNALGGAITAGETFSFTVSYDDGAPDLDSDPSIGTYEPIGFAIAGHVGGVPFQYDGVSNTIVGVIDSPNFVDFDEFSVATAVTPAATPGSFSAYIDLTNPVGLAVSSHALTGVPFGLGLSGGWTSRELQIDGPNWTISGAIEAMNGVPEPATALLLGSGLVALVTRRR